MAANPQIIEIVSKFTDGSSKKIKEVSRTVENLGGGMQRVTDRTRALNTETNRLRASMDRQRIAMKPFQAQWLSILFFGMALQRTFSGLIKTSLQWTGVMEIMSTALGILFLPLALMLLDWAISFLDFVAGLTEGQKKFAGALALTGIVIGGLLFTVGQLALGLAGMNWLLFGRGAANAGTAAAGAAGKMTTLIGKLGLIAAGLTITIVSIGFLSKGIEEGSLFKEVGGIIGGGLGGALIGLAIGGPWGAGIGFVLGIVGMIVIDWVMGGNIGRAAAKALQGTGLPGQGGIGGFIPGAGGIGSIPSIIDRFRGGGANQSFASSGEGNMTFAPTYNVTVADKAGFQSLLEQNSTREAEHLRSLTKS